ncbi:MAG: histone deacetylase [Gemmatimonadetes bacterium]|nr:histone deacetylase [Gemmatimonadota bacterium]
MGITTGFYLHPASPLHDTGWGHPEHQGRLRALASAVGREMLSLHGIVEQREGADADVEDLLRVHTQAHVDTVRAACDLARTRQALISLDEDTKVSSASWDAAVGSAGTAIAAAAAVASGDLRTAFVAARPPGHHATPERAMGFCLFNSIAIVARWLQAYGHAERVLIVDWDVHHGNGTQDAFYEDPSVYFLSLHQWPHYPGTGVAEERGSGAGEGYTLNVPLAAGTSRAEYRRRFEGALAEATGGFRPDFVLVSSGFDSMAGDPLGGLLLEPEDLHAMTRHLIDEVASDCGGRVVALLEGGYNTERLGLGTAAVLRALAGLPPA